MSPPAIDRDAFDALVYDLDGTLIDLAVDWDAVRADVVDVYRRANVEIEDGIDLWTLLERAPDHDLAAEVEATIAAHEREGAELSARLPTANELATASVPVAVCSLNCETACRLALEKFDLLRHVDAVIGRDSVDTHKPDPAPLLAAVERLGAVPETTLFVGDTERDERTARRAGTRFAYVDGASRR